MRPFIAEFIIRRWLRDPKHFSVFQKKKNKFGANRHYPPNPRKQQLTSRKCGRKRTQMAEMAALIGDNHISTNVCK